MRVLLALLFISSNIFAATVIRDAAVTTVPGDYVSAGVLQIDNVGGRGWSVINNSAVDAFLCLTDGPAAGCTDGAYIPASSFIFKDWAVLPSTVILRGDTAISAGTIELSVNTNN